MAQPPVSRMLRVMSDTMNTNKDWRERGYFMRTPPMVLVAYDPAGDGEDNDAFLVLTREEHQRGEPWDPDFATLTRFRIVLGNYMPPDLEYPDKLAKMLRLYKSLREWENSGRCQRIVFIIENNGIGYAMASDLRTRIADRVLDYTTIGTRGDSAFGEKGLIMPRLSALAHLKRRMEQHVVQAAKGAPGAKQLEKEINTFVWAAPGRPEALSGQRDDLVMCLCGGVWIGEKAIGPLLKQQKYSTKGRAA